MTMRLSMSSLAGIDRTEVAVGTARLASMFATTRAAGPRRTLGAGSSTWPPPPGMLPGIGCGAVRSAGTIGGDTSSRGAVWVIGGTTTAGAVGAGAAGTSGTGAAGGCAAGGAGGWGGAAPTDPGEVIAGAVVGRSGPDCASGAGSEPPSPGL